MSIYMYEFTVSIYVCMYLCSTHLRPQDLQCMYVCMYVCM